MPAASTSAHRQPTHSNVSVSGCSSYSWSTIEYPPFEQLFLRELHARFRNARVRPCRGHGRVKHPVESGRPRSSGSDHCARGGSLDRRVRRFAPDPAGAGGPPPPPPSPAGSAEKGGPPP